MKTETVRARIDAGLKASAEAIFQRLGLNTTTAITLFYSQVQLNEGLPFEVRIPNSATRRAMTEAEHGETEVFNSKQALLKSLKGEIKCSRKSKEQSSSKKTTND